MEKNEIIEGNKAIAEFLEWRTGLEKYNQQNDYSMPTYLTENSKHPGATMINVKGMKFHTSWDWIVPPCKKCAELCYNHKGSITNDIIVLNNIETNIRESVADYDIAKAYKYLTKFINYYNKVKGEGKL